MNEVNNRRLYAGNRNSDVARIGSVTRTWLLLPVAALGLGLPGHMWSSPLPPRTMDQLAFKAEVVSRGVSPESVNFARLAAFRSAAPVPFDPGSPFGFPDTEPPATTVPSPGVPTRRAPALAAAVVVEEQVPDLLGIAEQASPSGTTRTAVLAHGDQAVRFVRIGQAIGGVYRVSAIDADRVVLVDERTARRFELILK